MLVFYSNLSILIAFLASLIIYFRPNPHKYLRFFPILLAMEYIVQKVGLYLTVSARNSTLLYNVWSPVLFCFYFYFLSQIIHNRVLKPVLRWLPAVFAGLATIDMFFIQGKQVFNSMTFALGALLVVALCIFYFFELFQRTQPVVLTRQPAFWICAGLLFFHACTFPLLGLANFMRSAPAVVLNNFTTILDLLNVLLYLSFTIAFLCRIRVRSSTS